MKTDLTAQLVADAPLAALVGERITWRVRDQGAGLPAVVLTRVWSAPDYVYRGQDRLRQHRVQVDVYAASEAQAEAVTSALFNDNDTGVLDRLSGLFRGRGFVIDGPEDSHARDDAPGGDGGQDIFRTRFDVRLFHLST